MFFFWRAEGDVYDELLMTSRDGCDPGLLYKKSH